MKVLTMIGLGAMLGVLGCNPTPRKVPCETYVAGSFTAENNYALAVEASGWPPLRKPGERIELTFFLGNANPRTVDLVQVVESHELERWTLHVPAGTNRVPICLITADSASSTCDARIQLLPHNVGGYYYLRSTDGGFAEVGMSFVLCR